MPGWTGEPKWNYLKRYGGDMRPERRFRAWRRSMAFTGEWSGRRAPEVPPSLADGQAGATYAQEFGVIIG